MPSVAADELQRLPGDEEEDEDRQEPDTAERRLGSETGRATEDRRVTPSAGVAMGGRHG